MPKKKSNNTKKAAIVHKESPKIYKEEYKGKSKFLKFYFDNYKSLLIIPILLLVISMVLIGVKVANTGEFVNKGISLKGGTVVSIPEIEQNEIEVLEIMNSEFPNFQFATKTLQLDGRDGVIIETDITQLEDINSLTEVLKTELNLASNDYTIETIGASLGESFFRQTFRALILAFVFMAIVVFLRFKTFIPSIAVVLAAFSNMVITLAAVNAFGIQLSTAGIAAFLMLIGYSVDTDIVLTTKVIKDRKGSVIDGMIAAGKTGLTMTLTTLVAVTVALIVAKSDVLIQIMTILIIGLVADIINTWLQNAAILRMYAEKRERK